MVTAITINRICAISIELPLLGVPLPGGRRAGGLIIIRLAAAHNNNNNNNNNNNDNNNKPLNNIKHSIL